MAPGRGEASASSGFIAVFVIDSTIDEMMSSSLVCLFRTRLSALLGRLLYLIESDEEGTPG